MYFWEFIRWIIMSTPAELTVGKHDLCKGMEQKQHQELPPSPWKRRVFHKCSISEQIETLRQNGLHKFGSASSYKRPLFPGTKYSSDDHHPWSCKRHCSLQYLLSNIAW